MTQEEKLEFLEKAYIPEEWREHCFISDDKMIFTPRFDDNGEMLTNGEQAYQEWLENKDKPVVVEPTAEEKVHILEKQLADLEIARLLD